MTHEDFDYPIIRLKGKIVNLCVFRTDKDAVNKYIKWINDESILQWIGSNNKIYDYTEELEYATNPNPKGTYRFNIVIKENNSYQLIGNCDIRVINGTRNGILGILIGDKNSRNKGYGTEAIKMLIKYGFEQLNLHRIGLTLNSDNKRALKCYEKAGMTVCGKERETQWYNGKWADTVHMDILEQEYFDQNS